MTRDDLMKDLMQAVLWIPVAPHKQMIRLLWLYLIISHFKIISYDEC